MHIASAKIKCGAKTRDGSPCEKPPAIGRTRCRLHGGASPSGIGHPRFIHGAYSICPVSGLLERRRREFQKQTRAFVRWVVKEEKVAEVAYERLVALADRERLARKRGRPRLVPDFDTFFHNHLMQRTKARRIMISATPRGADEKVKR